MKIANVSSIPQMVKVDLNDGRTAEIRVMPKARVELPPKAKLNERWVALNGRAIHVFPKQRRNKAEA